VSRRRRAAVLVVAAAAAAGLGVALVSGYSNSVSQSYGRLRPVVVVTGLLAGGELLTPRILRDRTEIRQVPARFVPARALPAPDRALGFEPQGPLAAGSYLTAGILRRPEGDRPGKPRIARGRVPVELTVSGAGALSGPGTASGRGRMVDVLVTEEGRIGGRGKTRIAALRVPLLTVVGSDPAGAGTSRVVLGLTRSQAISLIDAESFARRLTVLPR
jgi:hypothetical protein